MKIYLASDHAGLKLKDILVGLLREKGKDVEDMGPYALVPEDDYPDYCIPLAHKVAADPGSFGVVVGKSGVGEAIAANRVKGARAVVYHGSNTQLLGLSREHNDTNILSFGAAFVDCEEACSALEMWMNTNFSGDERHIRRIKKLDAE